ncbi:ubiquinone oxidoreductase 20 kd subunit [Boletus edulis]|nr:ubiquinone oxidoreductase 20 kd subunit [Boletus edulis]
MLSRRVVSRFSTLKTLARASSTAAGTPTPPVPASERRVAPQSTSEKPRPVSRSSPRFEQTFTELQPNPLSAMELIANEPVRVVHGRKAVCDGGGGALGHPKIFINLDQLGPQPCGYSGLRFEQAPHGHEH